MAMAGPDIIEKHIGYYWMWYETVEHGVLYVYMFVQKYYPLPKAKKMCK